jgi:hypothetical protein
MISFIVSLMSWNIKGPDELAKFQRNIRKSVGPRGQENENMKRKVLRTWERLVSLVNPVLKERLMAPTKRIEEGERP